MSYSVERGEEFSYRSARVFYGGNRIGRLMGEVNLMLGINSNRQKITTVKTSRCLLSTFASFFKTNNWALDLFSCGEFAQKFSFTVSIDGRTVFCDS